MHSPAFESFPNSAVFTKRQNMGHSKAAMFPQGYKVHYTSDGSGRDTYVQWSAGGLFKEFSPREQPKNGHFVTMKRLRPPAQPASVISPTAIHYHNDGSGRDTYVSNTDGGLTHNRNRLVDFRTAFRESLRKPDRLLTSYVKEGGHETGVRKSLYFSLTQVPSYVSNDKAMSP